MKIVRLQAHNFRKFESIDLDLQGKSTVIFGVNGTGKSTVLNMVNCLFQVWVNHLESTPRKKYRTLSQDVIRIGSSECSVCTDVKLGNSVYKLSRQCYERAHGNTFRIPSYDRKLYDALEERILERYAANGSIPIFVNYGINRSVLDITLQAYDNHDPSAWTALVGATEQQLNFGTFFEWFRNQEDIENEIKIETANPEHEDIMLKCVRKAIEKMLGNMSELKVKRNPLCMKVKKGDQEIRVDYLSDGEKCTLALFGDLARRIAIANQHKENPLEGEGVVLIDEIELHMHPSWQRRVLGVLADVFPNVQFIITTHSPQVLGEADERYNIVFLEDDACGNHVQIIERMDGFDSNYILEEYMKTSSKNEKVKELIRSVNYSILNKEFEQAEKQLDMLRKISGDIDREVILAQGYLDRSRRNS